MYEDNDVCTIKEIRICTNSYCTQQVTKYVYQLDCNKRGFVTYISNKEFKMTDMILFESKLYWKKVK